MPETFHFVMFKSKEYRHEFFLDGSISSGIYFVNEILKNIDNS